MESISFDTLLCLLSLSLSIPVLLSINFWNRLASSICKAVSHFCKQQIGMRIFFTIYQFLLLKKVYIDCMKVEWNSSVTRQLDMDGAKMTGIWRKRANEAPRQTGLTWFTSFQICVGGSSYTSYTSYTHKICTHAF